MLRLGNASLLPVVSFPRRPIQDSNPAPIMKEHSAVFLKWASQENDVDAEKLFKKWFTSADSILGPLPENELWLPRYDRPVSEPPIFDYEKFVENSIPSDIRLEVLFPGDPVKKTSHRDTCIIVGLVLKYWKWCERMIEADPARADFYKGLCKEVYEDYLTDQHSDGHVPYPEDSSVVLEYHWLDQDGDTKEISQALANGRDIFWEHDVGPAIDKYGRLAPPGYFKAIIKRRLMLFEEEWLDTPAGGTKRLQRWLDKGIDVFDNHPPEVNNKYAYLLPVPWQPVMSYSDWLLEYDGQRDSGQIRPKGAVDLLVDYDRHHDRGGIEESRDKFEAFIRERYLHISKENGVHPNDPTNQADKDDLGPPQQQLLSCYTTDNREQFSTELCARLQAVNYFGQHATWPTRSSLNADDIRLKGYNAGLGLRLHSWPSQRGRETIHRPLSGLSSVEEIE